MDGRDTRKGHSKLFEHLGSMTQYLTYIRSESVDVSSKIRAKTRAELKIGLKYFEFLAFLREARQGRKPNAISYPNKGPK